MAEICERFVLFGRHGAGKSSILLELERRGEYVVFEAAPAVKRLAEAKGQRFADDHENFESTVLALHFQREAMVPAEAKRVFVDRGAPDHLAFARLGRWTL